MTLKYLTGVLEDIEHLIRIQKQRPELIKLLLQPDPKPFTRPRLRLSRYHRVPRKPLRAK